MTGVNGKDYMLFPEVIENKGNDGETTLPIAIVANDDGEIINDDGEIINDDGEIINDDLKKRREPISYMARVEDDDKKKNISSVSDVKETTNNESYQTLIHRIQSNPEVVISLHKALDVIDADKARGLDYEREWESAYHKIPLGDIHIDLKNFQNRRAPYSEYSVQGIIDAIYKGEFKKALFGPIILWKDKSGKSFILSGHSRYEAFRRLQELAKTDPIITQFCKRHNYPFDLMPSLYINDISFDDAKMISLMSNALATAETDVERADVYRQMRETMKSHKEIDEFGKKCEKSNRPRVRAYSYLGANGMAMDTLYAFETGADNNHIIKRIAYWIGELRRKISEVSDLHENELFDRLLNKGIYGKNKRKGEIHKIEDFLEIIKGHIQYLKVHNEFSPDKMLNVNKIKELSYIMKYYLDTLHAYRERKKPLMEEFNALRRRISKLKATKDLPEEKRSIIAQLEQVLNISLKTIGKMDDVESATELLFDESDISLNSEEELKILERRQRALLQAIQHIEEEYYQFMGKKPQIEEAEKSVISFDLESDKK